MSVNSAVFSNRVNFRSLPSLDHTQLAHIRHMIRLARQIPGEWAYMGTAEPSQEGFDCYRYQLAFMVYTLALAQYHRTPAYRELYRDTIQKLIEKMLRYEVWGYWETTSRGSKILNPALEKLEEGNIDPVLRQNIMYSGHLLMMVGLYEMLYQDGTYDRPNSLTFQFHPVFRGFGRQEFHYDFKSLTRVIYSEFERNQYIGVECEPNGVFMFCNQFPILGFMLYDATHGTDIAAQVIPKFQAAWNEKMNYFNTEDFTALPSFYLLKQGVSARRRGQNIGTIPFMNVWNKDFCEKHYRSLLDEAAVLHPDGAIGVNLDYAIEAYLSYQKNPAFPSTNPVMIGTHDLGFLAMAASEMGDEQTLEGVLRYADTRLKPVWDNGCLYYERNDDITSEAYTSRLTGNAALAYARVNVKDGLRTLFHQPWSSSVLQELQVTDVPYPNVLIRQAYVESETGALVVSTVPGTDTVAKESISIRGMDRNARYAIEIDHHPSAHYDAGEVTLQSEAADIRWEDSTQRLIITSDFSRPKTIIVGKI